MDSRENAGFLEEDQYLTDKLGELSSPLKSPADLDPLIDRIGDCRVVMLGEATHGTSEFYTWRAKISQRLIEERDFSFICVEGDWPDCYRVNRFLKDYDGAGTQALDVAQVFRRWPTWMWANWETVAFIDRLRRINADRDPWQKIGFFGLDVYSLRDSLITILEFLEERDSQSLDAARRAFRCFEPYGLRGVDYGRATALVDANCREEVVELLADICRPPMHFEDDEEAQFNLRQNAQVLLNAENYYRTMMQGGPQSWNIRDRHMAATLEDLLHFHGPDAKAIVWAHNTHIGDARYTDMVADGMVNLGQLGRLDHGEDDVALVGFGTHRGKVIAGSAWGAPMEEKQIIPARTGSWEDLFHKVNKGDRLLIMDDIDDIEEFSHPRGHRAIGVVYRSGIETHGNYVSTVLPRRYDAFISIDESQALHPLHIRPLPEKEPDTYPWGL